MSAVSLTDPWERVRDGLRASILTGELKPGTRLLEEQVAQDFAVSRGPVREAIRALEVEGLVLRKPRIGSMVIPIDRQSVEELYSLRALLEPFAARRALERRPGPLLVRLSGALAAMRKAADAHDPAALVQPDLDFHSAFFREAEHERLLRVWEAMTGPLKILIGMSDRRATPEWEASLLGHESIYAAAQTGAIDACVAQIERHLEMARATVASSLR